MICLQTHWFFSSILLLSLFFILVYILFLKFAFGFLKKRFSLLCRNRLSFHLLWTCSSTSLGVGWWRSPRTAIAAFGHLVRPDVGLARGHSFLPLPREPRSASWAFRGSRRVPSGLRRTASETAGVSVLQATDLMRIRRHPSCRRHSGFTSLLWSLSASGSLL